MNPVDYTDLKQQPVTPKPYPEGDGVSVLIWGLRPGLMKQPPGLCIRLTYYASLLTPIQEVVPYEHQMLDLHVPYIMGLRRNNGKENGNYYLGFNVVFGGFGLGASFK